MTQTNIERNSVSAKDVEEIVYKVIDSNLSNKPNVEIVTNTHTENNGIHVHKVDHTVLSNSKKLQKCDVALLMDSNRKFSKVLKFQSNQSFMVNILLYFTLVLMI